MRVGLVKSIEPRVTTIAAALECHFSALDVGVAEQHRPIVGAAQRQIGVGDQPRQIVLDAQRRRRQDLRRRISAARWPAVRRPAPAPPARPPRRAARSKMLPGASMRRFHSAFFTVTVPPSVGDV